jgi:hypothetical protein
LPVGPGLGAQLQPLCSSRSRSGSRRWRWRGVHVHGILAAALVRACCCRAVSLVARCGACCALGCIRGLGS